MFSLSNVGVQRKAQPDAETSKTAQGSRRRLLLEALILFIMGLLLFCGTFLQLFETPTDLGVYQPAHSDAAKYQCYALTFWMSIQGVHTLPQQQCLFLQTDAPPSHVQRWRARGYPVFLINLLESQHSAQPFHALPYEYPLLALVPFTLPLLVPAPWYQVTFAFLMILVAVGIYWLLRRFRSGPAALVFVAYLVVGSWATAAGRFDIIPAALTLVALILAQRTKWRWAFLALALATMCKFYPLVLVVPFLIAQQQQYRGRWYAWQRWEALGVFVGMCAVVMAVSLALSVEDTLAPIDYFRSRPIEIESLPAVLLWLGKFAHHPVYFVKSFGSLNILSSWSRGVSWLSTAGLAAGWLYTFWLHWRGKLDLFTASLVTLLVMIVAGKVFSPQYVMWVTPLIAYVGGSNWRWLVSWGSVCILTVCIFPFLYLVPMFGPLPSQPAFFPLVLLRDGGVLGIVLVLLYQATRKAGVVDLQKAGARDCLRSTTTPVSEIGMSDPE